MFDFLLVVSCEIFSRKHLHSLFCLFYTHYLRYHIKYYFALKVKWILLKKPLFFLFLHILHELVYLCVLFLQVQLHIVSVYLCIFHKFPFRKYEKFSVILLSVIINNYLWYFNEIGKVKINVINLVKIGKAMHLMFHCNFLNFVIINEVIWAKTSSWRQKW